MLNRTGKILGLAVLIVIIGVIVYLVCFNKGKEDDMVKSSSVPGAQNTSGNEDMDASLKEIERINKESDLGGYKLLQEPPEGFNASIRNVLGNESDYSEGEPKDFYHCEQFNGTTGMTQITIQSSKRSFFGLHVGDAIDKAKETMEKEGYTIDSQSGTKVAFSKAYIAFYFETTPEQTINKMQVGLADPNTVHKD